MAVKQEPKTPQPRGANGRFASRVVAPPKPGKRAPAKTATPTTAPRARDARGRFVTPKKARKKPVAVAPQPRKQKPVKAPPKPSKLPPKKPGKPSKLPPKKPAKPAPKKPAKPAPKKPGKPSKLPPKKPSKLPPKKPSKVKPKQLPKVVKAPTAEPSAEPLPDEVTPSSKKHPTQPPPGLTTAERREHFYKRLDEEERKALEKRSLLTPAQARAKIASIVSRVRDHYFYQGFRTADGITVNADKTVDAEIMVTTQERMFEADDQALEFRKLINEIPHVIRSMHPDLWFSTRVHFESPEIVDENGDPADGSLVFDVVTSNLLDPSYVISENRWRSMAHQTAWQHGHGRLYGNIQGAVAIGNAVLTKYAQYRPTITFFTFKLSWNVHNVTPPKLR